MNQSQAPANLMQHVCLIGPLRNARREALEQLDAGPLLLPPISAHRQLRGPYTAAGAVLRALVPDALERSTELVRSHEIELLTVAPELRELNLATPETLTSLAIPSERTRFYSRLRTLRLSNGLAEFLRDYLELSGKVGCTLFIDDLVEADPTDQEFVATILRRIAPAQLRIVAGITPAFERLLIPAEELGSQPPGDPSQDPAHGLSYALRHYCQFVAAANGDRPADSQHATAAELAERYVQSDGTADDPEQLAAYDQLPEEARRRLHDKRRAELVENAEFSLTLGAIPYHALAGSDPAGAGIAAIAHGRDYCMDMGFYHASVAFCRLGRSLVDRDERMIDWWRFTNRLVGCLAILGEGGEAEAVCDEARSFSTDPVVHMECAYMTAMLYTRHLEPSKRDHHRALGWINEAITLASLLPDHRKHTFGVVFHWNGKALIEVHCGRLEEALRLVTEGTEKLDRELPPGDHRLHRSVLVHNRAQVLSALGRPAEALAGLREAVAADPNYPEYHFDLGSLLHKLSMNAEAIAEFDVAATLGPPFPELFYNRAEVRISDGDAEGALRDLSYVLELDPGYLDAYVNRAALHCDVENYQLAKPDVEAGLLIDPDNVYLLRMRSAMLSAEGQSELAVEVMNSAIDADPTATQSWAQRAAILAELGDYEAAISDLDQAMLLDAEGADGHLFNRAYCLVEAGRTGEAREDLLRYLQANPGSAAEVAELMPELVNS